MLFQPTSTCGFYQILGGISIGIASSSFNYIISNLPSHTTLHIAFNMLLIDQNPNDNY